MQRQYRLRLARDFQRMRQEGKVYSQGSMSITILPNGLAHNRYGLITPRRLGKAVVRNRVRRRLREALGLLHPDLLQGFDLLVVARSRLVGQPFAVLLRILKQLCVQSGLLTDSGLAG